MRVDLEELTVTLGARRLIADIDAAADPGEVVGVVGPNGSGKSTTLRCVYRALRPSAGTVRLDGQDITAVSLRENARRVAALAQEAQVEFDFTTAEIVRMGRIPHQRMANGLIQQDRDICDEAMRHVGVSHLAERSFLTLSGGERQRVLIARALAQRPRVLVLDEPTNHLDIRHQLEVLALVRRSGLTALAALHDLNLAASYCDRLYVLTDGRVAASGTAREVLTPALVAEVFGVRAHVVTHPTSGAPQLLFDDPADEDASAPAATTAATTAATDRAATDGPPTEGGRPRCPTIDDRGGPR